ncbi:MAG: aminoacyl-tRNA hydrolase [Balneolia bacterium]|nr:aminoacyl-tRNA hydrolase [Balneolia bacterium]
MTIIAGLGNIGNEYDGTRHNVGFDIADRLADKLSISFEKARGPYLAARGAFKGKPLVIIKPNTYMNRSGSAITKAIVEFKSSLENVLVCYDDLNLPPGKIRFRPDGSAGGHNGIQDIIERTGTRTFSRLRFGIGNDFPRGRQVDYVLGPFATDEMPDIEAGLEKSVEGILCFVRQGLVQTMNQFN